MKYEKLSEEEKAALEVALLSYSSAIGVLRTLFGNQSSDSTLYRKMHIGQESLIKKGLVSSNNVYQLTDLGYSIIPQEKLVRTIKTLVLELTNIREKCGTVESNAASLERDNKNLLSDNKRLSQIVQKYQSINEALEAFGFLGVDENWTSALVCTTILEFAIKDKLEKLGCPPDEVFNFNFENLVKKLKESLSAKEGRKFEGLFDPLSIRSTRNKLVHEGYKTKIGKDEARAVFVITKNIIRNIENSEMRVTNGENWKKLGR